MRLRQSIVAEASRWIGTPYGHQASLRGTACDCLGLVRGVWRHVYGHEPEQVTPYAPDWPLASQDNRLWAAAVRHMKPVDLTAALPGDVLLFRWRAHLPASHAAILSEPHAFIHAHDGACVAEVHFNSWWRRHAVAAFAFPDSAQMTET